MAAAAAAAAPATMDAYLQVTLRIENANMRERIMAEGYTSLDVLVKKDKDWVRELRISIKKSSTGNAASREVTLAHEERLVMGPSLGILPNARSHIC
jgi:signal transduction protein with GAF and PtsI domain